MAADLDERIEQLVSSPVPAPAPAPASLDAKAGLELGLNLSTPPPPPSHDPPSTTTVGATADCNDTSITVHQHQDTKEDEEEQEVKDDSDASYVFVISDENHNNNKQIENHLNPANLVDPPPPTTTESKSKLEEEEPPIAHAHTDTAPAPALEEITPNLPLSETNTSSSPIHQQGEKQKVATSSEAKAKAEWNVIPPSEHDDHNLILATDDETKQVEDENLESTKEQSKLDSDGLAPQGSHQPLITSADSELNHHKPQSTSAEAIDSESHTQQMVEQENILEDISEIEEKEEQEHTQVMVDDAAELNSHQTDDGEEQQTKPDSFPEIKDALDASLTDHPHAVPELPQLDSVEENAKEEETIKLEEVIRESDENHKSQFAAGQQLSKSEAHQVEPELHQLDHVEEREVVILTDEIVVDKHSQHTEVVTLADEIPMVENSKQKEVVTLANEIPVEEHSEAVTLANEIPMEKHSEDLEVVSEANLTPVEEHTDHMEVVTIAKKIPVEELPSEHKEVAALAIETPEEEHSVNQETVQNSGVEIAHGRSDEMQVEAEDKNENGEIIECLPMCHAEQNDLQTELNNSVEGGESMSASPVGEMKSEPEPEPELESNESAENSNSMIHSADNVESETEVGNTLVENGDGLPANHVDYKVSDDSLDRDLSVPNAHEEGVDIETASGCGNLDVGSVNDAELDVPVDVVKIESEAPNGCANLDDAPVNDALLDSEGGESATNKQEISNMDVVDGGSKPECINKVMEVQDEVDKLADDGNGITISEEVLLNKGIESNGSAPGSAEESATDAVEGPKVDDEVGKQPFYFLIRVPRYVDDNIRDQIRLAQQQVDERTQSRDIIRSTIQSRRGICSEYREKFEAARSEERAARDVLNAKRQELDAIQSLINRMKNENSIEDIDDRICNMEHRIQHETMPLKEEKQLIREIKQLNNIREQLASSLSRGSEAQLTLDERDKVEERFKLLKQELESARKEVLRTEAITRANRKIFFDENDKLKELQSQFRAADDFRQEAYVQMQNFKKQLYERNKYFRMYKDDVTRAEDYAFSGDREALQRLCVNQVETIMELWNRNDEFRNEYIRCNQMSTLRRLKTMDGRSLGPDEDPPVFRNAVDERVNDIPGPSANKIDSSLLVSSTEQEKPVVQDVKFVQKNSKANVKSVINLEQKNPTVKSKKESIPALLENGSATVSGREETEEKKQSKEEEELARKAEELRKEEAAAKLKEQMRLEEKAKAKEAEERKKRNAEKAQARAEIRARKEAEAKEKVREKRERKKEKKNAAAVEVTNGVIETESASSSETNLPDTTRELEIKDKPKMAAKRPKKPSVLAKQAKAIPPPLRNRGKRRMQQWMWIPLIILVIVILFLVGNSSYSFKLGLSSFGF